MDAAASYTDAACVRRQPPPDVPAGPRGDAVDTDDARAHGSASFITEIHMHEFKAARLRILYHAQQAVRRLPPPHVPAPPRVCVCVCVCVTAAPAARARAPACVCVCVCVCVTAAPAACARAPASVCVCV